MSKSKIATRPFNVKKQTLDFSRLYNIIELQVSTNNIATRELGIYRCPKFENCKFENCHFTVSAAKGNK
jgi:hypothetical protein